MTNIVRRDACQPFVDAVRDALKTQGRPHGPDAVLTIAKLLYTSSLIAVVDKPGSKGYGYIANPHFLGGNVAGIAATMERMK